MPEANATPASSGGELSGLRSGTCGFLGLLSSSFAVALASRLGLGGTKQSRKSKRRDPSGRARFSQRYSTVQTERRRLTNPSAASALPNTARVLGSGMVPAVVVITLETTIRVELAAVAS